jgi:uncharacterized membrane protein YphA (DoxX/SURF4 family)
MEHTALTIARIAVGLVLLLAGGAKIFSGRRYVDDLVSAYRILPAWSLRPVALGLPWFEVVLGVLLIVGVFATPVAAAGAALLTGFSLAIVVTLRRGVTAPCGCFGHAIPSRTSWGLVGRNVVMVLVLTAVSWNGGS